MSSPLIAASSSTVRLAVAENSVFAPRPLFELETADLPVISEFHGEAHATKTVVFYREETATTASHGQFVAPISGAHGWYLANPHDKPVTVRLQLSGYYKNSPGLLKIQRPQRPAPAPAPK